MTIYFTKVSKFKDLAPTSNFLASKIYIYIYKKCLTFEKN